MSDLPRVCGYIAIVGRPNVGKSTMLNHLLEQKISITSRKPQTTRYNMLGIKTEGRAQMIFVDTPGIHKGQTKAINKYMNKAASSALKDVDVVVFVVDKNHWTDEDDWVLQQLEQITSPVIIALNKVDQMDDKAALLPYVEKLSAKLPRAEIVPVSALKNLNLDKLQQLAISHLPEADHFYPDDQITDKSSRFLAAEIVREKITRQLGEELPYQAAVEIEEFEQDGRLITISALILVERDGQKRILIGEKGDRIKQIGQQARIDMERLFDSKVMLKMWVKVKGAGPMTKGRCAA
jgi:GTP-binding protein Era